MPGEEPTGGGRLVVVALEAEVTEEGIHALGHELAACVTADPPSGVVLDFARVPVVDGPTARACRDLARSLRLLGVPTALAGLSPGAAGCLALLGFDPDPLRPVRTPEEARALFDARGRRAVGDCPVHRIADARDLARLVRSARRLAAEIGFRPPEQSLLATAVSELATNALRYAGGGEASLEAVEVEGCAGIAVEVADSGPGIADLETALAEGTSTGGSLGLGLPGVRRIVDELRIETAPGRGTRARAIKLPARARPLRTGWWIRPLLSEDACGDDVVASTAGDLDRLAIVDVLGHGPAAHELALRIRHFLTETPLEAPDRTLARLHAAVKGSRGAAVGLAQLHRGTGRLAHVGVGNTEARIVGRRETTLPSRPGVIGRICPSLAPAEHELEPGDRLVLFTDGVSARFRTGELDLPATATERHWARELVERFGRPTDDAACLVARWCP